MCVFDEVDGQRRASLARAARAGVSLGTPSGRGCRSFNPIARHSGCACCHILSVLSSARSLGSHQLSLCFERWQKGLVLQKSAQFLASDVKRCYSLTLWLLMLEIVDLYLRFAVIYVLPDE